jgi:hypothetical protein
MMNAGLLVDLPQIEESGALRHRALPHRTAVHDRFDHAEGGGAGALLSQRAEVRRRAGR